MPVRFIIATHRGNGRMRIFADDHDRERFLLRLAESLDTYNARLYMFCLMSNTSTLSVKHPMGISAVLCRSWPRVTLSIITFVTNGQVICFKDVSGQSWWSSLPGTQASWILRSVWSSSDAMRELSPPPPLHPRRITTINMSAAPAAMCDFFM